MRSDMSFRIPRRRFRHSLVDHHFPAWSSSDGAPLEPRDSQDTVDCGWGVKEDSKATPLQSLDQVENADCDVHPSDVARVDGAVESTRLLCGEPDEPLHVVVAADDAVERDHVGGGNRAGEVDEVAVDELDPKAVAAALGFFARGHQVRRRTVQVDGAFDAS